MKEKVIFLDRDGVINRDPPGGYVTSIEEFDFIPGVMEAIRRLSAAGYKIFVISNQQGVGKGFYSQETLNEITAWMLKKIEGKGGVIAGVYYCVHLEGENCSCRKPKTTLVETAMRSLEGETEKEAFFIGDTERDIETGKSAGCRTILLLSGKTKDSNVGDWRTKPDYIFRDLKSAVDFVLESEAKPA